jgi:hypothetical protein
MIDVLLQPLLVNVLHSSEYLQVLADANYTKVHPIIARQVLNKLCLMAHSYVIAESAYRFSNLVGIELMTIFLDRRTVRTPPSKHG